MRLEQVPLLGQVTQRNALAVKEHHLCAPGIHILQPMLYGASQISCTQAEDQGEARGYLLADSTINQ